MIIQLDEQLSVETPLGHGMAIIFESGEDDNWWTVALDNGAIVTFKQKKIRMARSYSHERGISDEVMRGMVDLAPLDEKARKRIHERIRELLDEGEWRVP